MFSKYVQMWYFSGRFQRFFLNLLRDLGLIWSLASLASWRHSQWNLGISFSRFLTYATTKISWLLILLPFSASWSTLQFLQLQTDLQSCLENRGNQFEYKCFCPLQQAFSLDSSLFHSLMYLVEQFVFPRHTQRNHLCVWHYQPLFPFQTFLHSL